MSQAARHPLGLDASTVSHPRVVRVREIARDCAGLEALAVIYGDAGLGKSWALHAAAEDLANRGVRVASVTLATGSRGKALVEQLAGVLTGSRQDETRQHLIEICAAELSRGDTVVMIDEVQGLHSECVEVARHLLDRTSTHFGLVLCGGHGAYEHIRRHQHLSSRLDYELAFQPLNLGETVGFLRAFHPGWKDVHPQTVAILDERHARGIIRAWAKLTAHAVRSMRRRGLERIDTEAIAYALHQHGCPMPGELTLGAEAA